MAIGTFAFSAKTAGAQVKHNIDSEAHPSIAGQLQLIERELSHVAGEVDSNTAVLREVHDSQIEQKMLLKEIQRTIDGG